MKIMVLSGGIPSHKYPLNGVFAFDQAKALSEEGIDVYFLSVDFRSIRRLRKLGFSQGIKDGVKWFNYSLPIAPFTTILNWVEKPLIRYLFKKVFGDNEKPDLCHAHFTDMGVLANEIKRYFNIPYVITEHSSVMNQDEIPLSLLDKARAGYAYAERVITVSTLLAESIERKTGIKCVVIPNIIDTNIFRLRENKPHDGMNIVTTALLSERKRIHLLLQAVSELREICPNITLDIIGDGVDYDRLYNYAKEKFFDGGIRFHGMKSRVEAAEIYKLCDCFILPSALETFGVVYVEAMAAGLPVIATRCGGPEDFVNDSNGILIDVDDIDQLKEAIIYMYNHYKEYDAIKIKEDVTAKFSPEVVAKRIKSIYVDIILNKYNNEGN